MAQNPTNRRRLQSGFTLLEALIAIVIMSVGILSLAVVYAQGIQVANKTQLDYIAEKQAEQALETVFAARDSKLLTWTSIQNVSNGGVFLDNAQPLLVPGPDGLYGTADDGPTPVVVIINAGPDKILGTADDVTMPLTNMTRTIAIVNVPNETGLRQITITLNYYSGNMHMQYTLVSYISEFS